VKAGLYARVSTHEQQTLPMQIESMGEYAKRRGMDVVLQVEDIGSGTLSRPRREKLLYAARKREIDVILVWRLDRWGRSLADLVSSLQELNNVGVGFVSLSEALDMTTASGRALMGMLAVFAEFERDILRGRVKAGIAEARKKGRPHGRLNTTAQYSEETAKLAKEGMSKSEIARKLGIGRTTVRRLLDTFIR
jgi:DNA invertase Pin-like site-specific DNA recombinase